MQYMLCELPPVCICPWGRVRAGLQPRQGLPALGAHPRLAGAFPSLMKMLLSGRRGLRSNSASSERSRPLRAQGSRCVSPSYVAVHCILPPTQESRCVVGTVEFACGEGVPTACQKMYPHCAQMMLGAICPRLVEKESARVEITHSVRVGGARDRRLHLPPAFRSLSPPGE